MTDLAALAKEWVRQLPRSFVVELASALQAGPGGVQHLLGHTVAPASRHAAHRGLEVACGGEGAYLAGLLDGRCAATSEAADVRPVWTGPSSRVVGGRLTVAVVADLIAEAEQEVLLVSYATYPPESVVAALTAAVERGVSVSLLLERAEDNPGWTGLAEPFPDLHVQRLCWPLTERAPGASLHAKLLVVDRRAALVGSANLTTFALERNLECGLLVRGGDAPRMLVEHLMSARGLAPA